MKSRKPVFEKSRSVQDMQQLRLMALLGELVRAKGVMRAARELDVDHRTLTASLERGRLSRRMRGALERALLEGGGSPAADQRERNDVLEGRLDAVEGRMDAQGEAMNKGLAAVQGDVRAIRDGQAQVERRLTKLEAGGPGEDEGQADGPDTQPKGGTRLRREFPDLVTLEPASDDAEVFGDAWPLIVEWRKLKAIHPNRGRGLAWLTTQERLLTIELALLEEHGMTLPPEAYPLRDFARNGQINWRRSALSDTRRALRRLRWVRRVLTFGLWWR